MKSKPRRDTDPTSVYRALNMSRRQDLVLHICWCTCNQCLEHTGSLNVGWGLAVHTLYLTNHLYSWRQSGSRCEFPVFEIRDYQYPGQRLAIRGSTPPPKWPGIVVDSEVFVCGKSNSLFRYSMVTLFAYCTLPVFTMCCRSLFSEHVASQVSTVRWPD